MSGRLAVIVLMVACCNCVIESASQVGLEPRRNSNVSGEPGDQSRTIRSGEVSCRTSNSVVSITELKVPEKARNLLRKSGEAVKRGDITESVRYANEALEIYPHYPAALAWRAVLEQDGHLDKALADAEKAVEYDAYCAPGYWVLGSIYVALGRFDDAVRALDYVIAAMPNLWQAHYEMSRALLNKRDYEAAQYYIRKTYSLVPEKYPCLHLLNAHLMIGLHNIAAAIQELEAYLREEPNGPNVRKVKGLLGSLRAASPGTEPQRDSSQGLSSSDR